MQPASFSVTWDYRCPFARNVHEHLVAGLLGGADWDVTFVPFSLSQTKVEPGQPDVWDNPQADSGLLALQVGIAVRDLFPDQFLEAHRAIFAVRHTDGGDLRSEQALRDALTGVGVDADAVFTEVATGTPLETVRKEHERAASDYEVWGVPTFLTEDGHAVFVRLMDRPRDAGHATTSIDRIVTLLGWPELNEYKHTSLSR
jgi:protein-disulfide isomerase-like protein with CxxC motif